MEYREDIEQLFKDSFENFQAEVHPDAWANIQNAILVAPAAPSSVAVKVGGASSKFGAGLIASTAAIVAITAAVIYFSMDEKKNAEPVVAETVQVTEPQPETNNDLLVEPKALAEDKSTEATNELTSSNENPIAEKEITSHYVSSADNSIETAARINPTVSDEKKEVPNIITEPKPDVQSTDNSLTEAKQTETPAKTDEAAEENSVTPINANTESRPKSEQEYLGFIPNVITPNLDGKNDVFIISGTDLKSLKVAIYDNRGKLVHSWNNLHGFWDGKLENGQSAAAGVYQYHIFAETNEGTPLIKQGTFKLLQ